MLALAVRKWPLALASLTLSFVNCSISALNDSLWMACIRSFSASTRSFVATVISFNSDFAFLVLAFGMAFHRVAIALTVAIRRSF